MTRLQNDAQTPPNETTQVFRGDWPPTDDVDAAEARGVITCSSLSFENDEKHYKDLLRRDPTMFLEVNLENGRVQELVSTLKDLEEGAIFFDLSISMELRNKSILALLRHVKTLFREDPPSITRQVELQTPSVPAKGVADFMIERGECKIVFVVITRNDDLNAAIAQNFVMLDILAAKCAEKGDNCDKIFGIATDFERWAFVKRSTTEITWCKYAITERELERNAERVLSILYGMLQNE